MNCTKNSASVTIAVAKLRDENFDTEYDRRRFHRTTEVIPRRPWKSKSPFVSRPIKISIKQRGRKGCARGTTRYFLHSFPSFGPLVVQSYRSPRIEHKLLFLKLFGRPWDIPGKIPAKKFGFPVFRRTYRTFWPSPLQVEDPHPFPGKQQSFLHI